MRHKAIWVIFFLAILIIGSYIAYSQYAAGLYYLAGKYDRMMNPYGVDPDAPEPDEDDRALHQSLFIADLHIDTLKWERDLLARSLFGHADVPRLAEGNVGLQVFTIVTKSPLRMPAPWSSCVSGGMPDTNTVLAFLQGRPMFNLRDRAFYQIARFKEAVARSKESAGPELRLIETADDLSRLVADRLAGEDVIGGVLGIEGGHWIGGPDVRDEDVRAAMRELHVAGVRLFAPTHRFDNSLSGSSEGCEGYGLTAHGRAALGEAEALGMVVDLAHISSAGLRDAADLLESPFTVSHTGIRAECEAPCQPDRNLSDDDIKRVIAGGGVIGVGFWPQAIGPSVWRIAEVMAHIKDLARELGVEDPSHHVALGSDYDGSVTPLIEVGHLNVITAIMRQRSQPFGPTDIRNIMGANVCRLFATVLPGGSAETAPAICAGAAAANGG
ncbi:MAG: membrane dipeptidase [Aquisalimonadaceae bacterium]